MIYKTWGQIRAKVERELDIEVEEFIQPEEFVEYVNDGVALCEAQIHDLGLEDLYFRTRFPVPLTQGVEDYSLPSPIYMNKILSFIYSYNNTIYEILQLRGPQMYENIARINQYNSVTDYYRYLIRNDSAANGVKIQIVPISRETNATAATLWFIREAAKWNFTTDQAGVSFCDLPQIALQFLYQYVKYRCYEKEGHANMDSAKSDLERIQAAMISMMENMVPDNNNELIKDLSSYQDMS